MSNPSLITVWDPLIRLFHWLLVGAFATSWLTQEQHYDLHLQSGYTILVLIILRIIWGMIGSRHARFSDFIYPPTAISGHLQSLAKGNSKRYHGHNPAGGAMILMLLISLLTVNISGIALDGAENWSGPMADMNLFRYRDLIHSTHVMGTNLLLILVAVHVLGVVHASIVHKENLVWSMITGRKRAD
jgi:cytochrome b